MGTSSDVRLKLHELAVEFVQVVVLRIGGLGFGFALDVIRCRCSRDNSVLAGGGSSSGRALLDSRARAC